MIRLIVLSVFFFGGIGYILFQMYRFYISLQSTRSQVQKDIKFLQDEITAENVPLVDLDDTELKLLSLAEDSSELRSFKGKYVIGNFTSIFHETLIAYGIKEYASSSKLIIIVKSAAFEIRYECDEKQTTVYWNEKVFGKIDSDGYIWNEAKTIKMGRIDISEEVEQQQIFIDDRAIAAVNNPYQLSGESVRAFSMIKEMDDHDRHVCLSLALLNLIQRTDIKKVYS